MSRQSKLLSLWLVVLFFTAALWGGGYLVRERITAEEQARAEAAAALRVSAVVALTQQHLQQVRALLSAVRQFQAVSSSPGDTLRFIDGLGFDKSVVQRIDLLNAEGQVVQPDAGGSSPAAAGAAVSDAPLLDHHRDPAHRGSVHVSHVEPVGEGGALVFRVSMRVNRADGQFAGVVAATLLPAGFDAHFQSINQGVEGRVVSVLGTQDRLLRAHWPVPEASQWSQVVDAPVWGLLASQAKGQFVAAGAADTVQRTHAFQALAEWPLVAVAGFSQAEVAASAHVRVQHLLVPAVAITVFVLMLATAVTGLVLKREDVLQANRQLDQLLAQMRAQATHDKLTGLPNRSLFFERLSRDLARARRAKQSVALMCLDLDGFKHVNDQHGHEAGDCVLIEVAARWQAAVRETDTVARIGGDEFAIILPHAERVDDVKAIATKLIGLAGQVIDLPNQVKVKVGVSIGIGLYPLHGTEIDTLLAAADTAMYQSKAMGKNRFTLSDAEPSPRSDTADWLVFTDAHLTGMPDVDHQHRELVRQVNAINRALTGTARTDDVRHLFDDLLTSARHHFDTENRLMSQLGYPAKASHEQAHQALLNELGQLASQLDAGNELLLLQTLKDWLLHHIEHPDRPLGAYAADRV